MTTLERLIYMVNQIARNLTTQAEGDPAIAVADHVAAFWDPRMRSMIDAHWGAGGSGLDPDALAAIAHLHHVGQPEPQTRATDPAQGGSDAG